VSTALVSLFGNIPGSFRARPYASSAHDFLVVDKIEDEEVLLAKLPHGESAQKQSHCGCSPQLHLADPTLWKQLQIGAGTRNQSRGLLLD
jgi:hypothetical protein